MGELRISPVSIGYVVSLNRQTANTGIDLVPLGNTEVHIDSASTEDTKASLAPEIAAGLVRCVATCMPLFVFTRPDNRNQVLYEINKLLEK